MKILFDTNILVRITDVRTEMPKDYAEIVRLSNRLHHTICYHPAQEDDLKRDTDLQRMMVNLSRINQYQRLPDTPLPSQDFLNLYDWQQADDNSRVDNELLYAAFQGAVNYLVTEDKKMHHKAKRAAITDLVVRVDEMLAILKHEEESHTDTFQDSTQLSNIDVEYLRNIPLNDPIFDSLKLAYPKFNIWFRMRAAEDRMAWVARDNEKRITAICIFKEEGPDDDIGGGVHLSGKTLKLCTFKVAGRGEKLGERMLQKAFLYAADQNFDYLYMQIHEGEQPELETLIGNFGFTAGNPYCNDGRTDYSFVKQMRPLRTIPTPTQPADILRFDIDYYPYFCDDAAVQKFLVPIRRGYHSMLFPESRSLDLLERAGCYGHPAENNAITKAYICNANTRQIRPGDLLLFYNLDSHSQEIEVVAFVDRVFHCKDPAEAMNAIARRTVYPESEVRQIVSKSRGALVILFRILHYLPHPITRRGLLAAGVEGNIQSIRTLPDLIYQAHIHPQLKKYTYENRA